MHQIKVSDQAAAMLGFLKDTNEHATYDGAVRELLFLYFSVMLDDDQFAEITENLVAARLDDHYDELIEAAQKTAHKNIAENGEADD